MVKTTADLRHKIIEEGPVDGLIVITDASKTTMVWLRETAQW